MHGDESRALESFVETAAAEHDLVVTLRHMRQELYTTSMRHLVAHSQDKHGVRQLLKISNDRLECVIADARQLPVKTDLELEALRLLVENAHLRKAINGYSDEFLAIAAAKQELREKASWPQAQVPASLPKPDGEAVRWSLKELERREGARATERERERRWLTEKQAKEQEEKEWWVDERLASMEGARIFETAEATDGNLIGHKWELMEAERLEAAYRAREREDIDKRAQELQVERSRILAAV